MYLTGCRAALSNAFAERYAANQLSRKTSREISEWLASNESRFIDEVPGLREKLTKYGSSLAKREGDAAVAEQLEKQYKTARQTAKQTEKQTIQRVQDVKNTLDDLRIKIADAKPQTLLDEWSKTGGLRKKLEDTNMFTPAELDSLRENIVRIGQAATKVERFERYKQFTDFIVKKSIIAAGLGGAGTGAYTAYKTIFGGQ